MNGRQTTLQSVTAENNSLVKQEGYEVGAMHQPRHRQQLVVGTAILLQT